MKLARTLVYNSELILVATLVPRRHPAQ
jgi:hypothetical protein